MRNEQRVSSRSIHRPNNHSPAPWRAVLVSLVGIICLVFALVQPVDARTEVASEVLPSAPSSRDIGTMKVISLPTGSTAFMDSLGVVGTPGSSEPTSFSAVINAGATLSLPEYADALAAFERAAQQWAGFISDPITINIDADFAPLPTNVIGSTDSVLLQGEFNEVRDAMVVDSADETDDGIVAYLPTHAQFSALVPTGDEGEPELTLADAIVATKGNFKAMGFTGLDDQFGASDATITFSTNFSFDFDNSDGVDPGTMDFETVAAHEIGHVLGFISMVDTVDYLLDEGLEADVGLSSLDMFCFLDGLSGLDPSNPSEFTTFPRLLAPGFGRIFDQIDPADDSDAEIPLSEGYFSGDGRQASHWKDNNLTGTFIGIMDPTLSYGQTFPITDSDLRALDLIGYDIQIPEPATLVLLATGALLVISRKRRR